MPSSPELSIIIPVFNEWQLTKSCLEACAETLKGQDIELIVVDNASQDDTARFCESYGTTLFGERFRYHRFDINRNFGPASNYGADIARGTYLLFLNNDTIPQGNWLPPLLQDFAEFPNIAATGPLLVYPKTEPFGYTVQHLGVTITPFLSVSHLYEGIPAESPLAKKRRFFQIITAACMLIPKQLFFDAGRFDEHYKNGIEDIDLCAHLFEKGLRMTVNPASVVIHHTSQSQGRDLHETENYRYFEQHCKPLLAPDLSYHTEQDGLELRLNPWLQLYPHCKKDMEKRLNALAAKLPRAPFLELLAREPLWEQGWNILADDGLCLLQRAKLFPSPEYFLGLFHDAKRKQNTKLTRFAISWASMFYRPWEDFCIGAKEKQAFFTAIGEARLSGLFEQWSKNAKETEERIYRPFFKEMEQILQKSPNKAEL
ncbi:MAG: glycosyltransferase family 2 protein [Desulfovibrio sp.]|nr:glycosyltransferase family 2 protein [Desulfovibrio sp.]